MLDTAGQRIDRQLRYVENCRLAKSPMAGKGKKGKEQNRLSAECVNYSPTISAVVIVTRRDLRIANRMDAIILPKFHSRIVMLLRKRCPFLRLVTPSVNVSCRFMKRMLYIVLINSSSNVFGKLAAGLALKEACHSRKS